MRAGGYIEVAIGGGEKRKNYNARIRLTEQGRELAQTITGYAMAAQLAADSGVSEEELQAFYTTLRKLSNNLSQLAEQPKALKADAV